LKIKPVSHTSDYQKFFREDDEEEKDNLKYYLTTEGLDYEAGKSLLQKSTVSLNVESVN